MVGRVGFEPTTFGLKGRCSTTELPAHTYYYTRLRAKRKRIFKTSSATAKTTVALEVLPGGSGGWIRTIDLRVMSPTSCHCSTPRWGGRTDLVSQRSYRQYLRRCRVSRPGSGWNGVGPRRFAHATGSGASAEGVGEQQAIAYRTTTGLPAGKPSSMRTRRLHPSRGLQLGPLSQSSPGGLTRL